MKLSVIERLILLNILPAEGNFTTIKLVRQLRETLSFSEKEHAQLQFSQEGDQVRWLDGGLEAVGKKDCKIGEKMTDLIQDVFKKLDSENKLTEQHLDLYEKFMK